MDQTTVRDKAARRVRFEGPVALVWNGQAHFEATALNLSRGGMFVHSAAVGFVPAALRVLFELPDEGPIDARVAVVRVAGLDSCSEPPGVALRFESMSDDCARRLRRFVESRLDPDSRQWFQREPSDSSLVVGSMAARAARLPSKEVVHDERHDPVLTSAFVEHVRTREYTLAAPGQAATLK